MRKLVLSLFTFLFIICSCTEEIDTSARYVFSEYTVAGYLDAHEEYSQYVELTKLVPVSGRSKSSVYQLLTARGNYTCFALTNEAIDKYLQDLVEQGLISEPSWDAFTDDRKLDSVRKVVVQNTVIDGGDMESQRYTIDLITSVGGAKENAELPLPTIYDHKLTVRQDKEDVIYLDNDCNIDPLNCDIPAINGVLHQLHKVIAPKDESCARYLQIILDEQREGYLMFAKAIQACGLLDTLSKVRDEVYESLYQAQGDALNMENYMDKGGYDMTTISGDPHAYAPEHRKYGFTFFCETDDFWQSQGIDPKASDAVEKLQEWIASNGMYLSDGGYQVNNNYASPKNMLHQWLVYHILPMRIPANKLVYHCNENGYFYNTNNKYTIPVFEWYPVYEGGRLLKIYESAESNGIFLNSFPERDNDIRGTGHESYCAPEKRGIQILTNDDRAVVTDIVNACIYPIDKPLAYTDVVREDLGKERIRFDLFALFPEAITNGIRRADSPLGKWQHVFVSLYNRYQYFENMTILNEETHFIHYNGYKANWANYSGDEDKAFGHFDIMFKLPPVPVRNTYEFRYKLLATAARGIVQVYFGTDPDRLPVAGIPIDMRKNVEVFFGDNATWSDLQDGSKDDDEIIEIDHKLRNHGLMKATKHEHDSELARDKSNCSRHIIVRQTLDPNETYYVRFKSVQPDLSRPELYLDYFEYCPKEIYDSPERPEDVW
ncbi:MAG: hypothetical protein IJ219_11150 [Bacteroidaceae bacterium]|nr:hypothetical protein [Bacteroidaceae bacterium]MBQ9295463.1 hypothetical protein [Bacteroidaceae bacterium]